MMIIKRLLMPPDGLPSKNSEKTAINNIFYENAKRKITAFQIKTRRGNET